jgi:hypothetical protein
MQVSGRNIRPGDQLMTVFFVRILFTRRKFFDWCHAYATKISIVQFIFLLFLLCHFGPFSGHGLLVVRVSRQLSFYVAVMLAPRPNPKPGGPGYISLPDTSLAACLTRLVLTGSMLSSAYLASQLAHANSHTLPINWHTQTRIPCQSTGARQLNLPTNHTIKM